MSRFLHRPGHRVLRVGALAMAVASFAAMSQALPARADDERDAAANAAAEAEATVNALQSQLEGIDASLAQVFIDLQALNGQIPVAQAAYETATATYDAKSREHATLLGELRAAQGEQNRIDQSLSQATTQADDAQRAIADLVRRKYREGNVDPVAVALTAGGTESITNRAAAADMALRTESQTMTAALDVSSSQRTQATRQGAITDRIADLEVKAAQAEAEALAGRRQSVVDEAAAQLGVPYAYGGTTPSGFDCSGFTRWVFSHALGRELPRTAAEQSALGTGVSLDELVPGDLLFWGRGSGVYHVGIYAGDGEYIHASTGGGRVMRATFDYFAPDFAKRVIE